MKMVLITDLVFKVDTKSGSDNENTLHWLCDWLRFAESSTVFGSYETCSYLLKLTEKNPVGNFLVKELPGQIGNSLFRRIVRPYQALTIALRFLLAARKCDHLLIHYSGGRSAIALFLLPFFSTDAKTVIYDRNWGVGSKRSRTEGLLRLLLGWKFFTRRSQILIYNEPLPTQTAFKYVVQPLYKKIHAEEIRVRKFTPCIKFLHTGGLDPEFQPVLACKLIRRLVVEGYPVKLHFHCKGNDSERKPVEDFIKRNELEGQIHLHSIPKNGLSLQVFREAHFFLYLVRDAVWPISIAKAMSLGCLPVATPVGCIPQLIGDNLERGILTIPDPEVMASNLKGVLNNEPLYAEKANAASLYSARFSPEKGRREILEILNT
ncbi:MAG: glycosyltransferase family 1 protein [Saprospirales bacterium]|nr:MAG: glycosyltransferase family 1 protein [Saprospirales bacterium]